MDYSDVNLKKNQILMMEEEPPMMTRELDPNYPKLEEEQDNAYKKFIFKSFVKNEKGLLTLCCFCTDDKSQTSSVEKLRKRSVLSQSKYKCGSKTLVKCGMSIDQKTVMTLLNNQLIKIDQNSDSIALPWLICNTCRCSTLRQVVNTNYPSLNNKILYNCNCKNYADRISVEIDAPIVSSYFNISNYHNMFDAASNTGNIKKKAKKEEDLSIISMPE